MENIINSVYNIKIYKWYCWFISLDDLLQANIDMVHNIQISRILEKPYLIPTKKADPFCDKIVLLLKWLQSSVYVVMNSF